jgi:hypothetical protein
MHLMFWKTQSEASGGHCIGQPNDQWYSDTLSNHVRLGNWQIRIEP